MNMRTMFGWLVLASALGVMACSSSSPAPAAKHAVRGSISGLSGTGLVLQNNGGDDLTVQAGATSFQFATALAKGSAYSVSIRTQPTKLCVMNQGSGTVGDTDVSSVTVTCALAYSISTSVSGLPSGASVVL